MAKMFYTLDEAAQKLGVAPAQVREMVTSGQLQEFRDRDRLVFKVEQVDLLAHKDEPGGAIPLADSGAGSSMALSLEDSGGGGSSAGIDLDENPKEKSGISIFDTDDLESADPSAQTQVSATGAEGLTMESVGSGSGLLDLTREGDDTSLGADLLEEVYQPEAGATEGETGAASGLFETTSAASDVSAAAGGGAAMVMMAAEPYDGPWSGFAGGLALGACLVVATALAVTILGLIGVTDNAIVAMVAPNFMVWVAVCVGIVFLPAIVGWAICRRS